MLTRFPWFTNYAQRKLEWCIAIYTVWFGLWLSGPWDAMNPTSFDNVLKYADEHTWGAVYVVVGVLHNYALHVNGRSSWTPFVRCGALLLNCNVFLAMTIGLAQTNPGGTAVSTYSFMVFGFCGAALWSAASDMGREIKIWRKKRHGRI